MIIYDVLVVDDDRMILDMLDEILTEMDLSVTSAESGEEALELLDENNFDLVMSDLKMGLVDGIEVIDTAMKKVPRPTRLILTGQGSLEAAIEAIRVGADDFLLKDAGEEEIKFRVSNALDKRSLYYQVKFYEAMVVMCSKCKKLRDPRGNWKSIESFIKSSMGAESSHGICPECKDEFLKSMRIL